MEREVKRVTIVRQKVIRRTENWGVTGISDLGQTGGTAPRLGADKIARA